MGRFCGSTGGTGYLRQNAKAFHLPRAKMYADQLAYTELTYTYSDCCFFPWLRRWFRNAYIWLWPQSEYARLQLQSIMSSLIYDMTCSMNGCLDKIMAVHDPTGNANIVSGTPANLQTIGRYYLTLRTQRNLLQERLTAIQSAEDIVGHAEQMKDMSAVVQALNQHTANSSITLEDQGELFTDLQITISDTMSYCQASEQQDSDMSEADRLLLAGIVDTSVSADALTRMLCAGGPTQRQEQQLPVASSSTVPWPANDPATESRAALVQRTSAVTS